jgi:hypothetical protein
LAASEYNTLFATTAVTPPPPEHEPLSANNGAPVIGANPSVVQVAAM